MMNLALRLAGGCRTRRSRGSSRRSSGSSSSCKSCMCSLIVLSTCCLRHFSSYLVSLNVCVLGRYLDHNLLFGTIPKQLGSLRNLRVLDLGANRLAGPIPPELSGLNSVSVINLHSNGLTGNIPPQLGKLPNLVQLRLDRNRLKGSIPGGNATGFSPMADTGSVTCPNSFSFLYMVLLMENWI
uniref:LRR receptor-like serine/threonine-protein kinase n=1 Tax=Aegilops tauschii subsp. strangulata TaxID=200361 RepID=A0A453DIC3_AEGTS